MWNVRDWNDENVVESKNGENVRILWTVGLGYGGNEPKRVEVWEQKERENLKKQEPKGIRE